jgi:hypothetical protein
MGSQKNLAIVAIVLGIAAVLIFGVYFMKTVNGGLSNEEMNKVAKPIVLPGPGASTSTALPPPPGGGGPTLPMGGGPNGATLAPPGGGPTGGTLTPQR